MRILSFILSLVIALAFFPIKAGATDLGQISANGAILIDATTGEVLFEKNAYTKMPMASTTKIMSTLIALEQDDLDQKFVVDSEAIKVEGSSMGLVQGDVVTLRTLAYGMMLPSGNDAANCAAVRIAGSVENFVSLMNDRAVEMGLNSTHFVTPSGLDDDTEEHYSTASDMAKLTREALKNEDFRQICSCKNVKLEFGNPASERWLINSNKLLSMYDDVIGVKTGFTDKARRCLVSACERNGATLICVTLNAPDDWIDHKRLFDYGFSMMSEQELPIKSDNFEVPVVGGVSNTVFCKTEKISMNFLNGKAKDVTSKVFIKPFLYCATAENTEVGRVEYYYNNEKIAEKPIYTSSSVGRKTVVQEEPNFFDKIKKKTSFLFS